MRYYKHTLIALLVVLICGNFTIFSASQNQTGTLKISNNNLYPAPSSSSSSSSNSNSNSGQQQFQVNWNTSGNHYRLSNLNNYRTKVDLNSDVSTRDYIYTSFQSITQGNNQNSTSSFTIGFSEYQNIGRVIISIEYSNGLVQEVYNGSPFSNNSFSASNTNNSSAQAIRVSFFPANTGSSSSIVIDTIKSGNSSNLNSNGIYQGTNPSSNTSSSSSSSSSSSAPSSSVATSNAPSSSSVSASKPIKKLPDTEKNIVALDKPATLSFLTLSQMKKYGGTLVLDITDAGQSYSWSIASNNISDTSLNLNTKIGNIEDTVINETIVANLPSDIIFQGIHIKQENELPCIATISYPNNVFLEASEKAKPFVYQFNTQTDKFDYFGKASIVGNNLSFTTNEGGFFILTDSNLPEELIGEKKASFSVNQSNNGSKAPANTGNE